MRGGALDPHVGCWAQYVRYDIYAHRIVSKRMEAICQHHLLNFCTVLLLVRLPISFGARPRVRT